jgi:hypothetical protein
MYLWTLNLHANIIKGEIKGKHADDGVERKQPCSKQLTIYYFSSEGRKKEGRIIYEMARKENIKQHGSREGMQWPRAIYKAKDVISKIRNGTTTASAAG